MPDDELDHLRDDVVVPVTRSILRDDELDSVDLWREDGETWVRVVARGEVFCEVLSSPSWEGFDRAAPRLIAERLADHLGD